MSSETHTLLSLLCLLYHTVFLPLVHSVVCASVWKFALSRLRVASFVLSVLNWGPAETRWCSSTLCTVCMMYVSQWVCVAVNEVQWSQNTQVSELSTQLFLHIYSQSLQKNTIMWSHNSIHNQPKSAYLSGGCIFSNTPHFRRMNCRFPRKICGAYMIS